MITDDDDFMISFEMPTFSHREKTVSQVDFFLEKVNTFTLQHCIYFVLS